MKILYGTNNPAKLASMRRLTRELQLEILGLRDLDMPIPEIEERGQSPLENARIKAEAYFEAFGIPVFSCDSGLYFEGLPEELQPGIHVRRVKGKVLTDEEMTDYYAALARDHGGTLVGHYRNAICLILDREHIFSSMDPALHTEAFLLTDKAHPRRDPGFPLDPLSVDLKTGKYYHDLPNRSVDQSAIEQGFREFFRKALKEWKAI